MHFVRICNVRRSEAAMTNTYAPLLNNITFASFFICSEHQKQIRKFSLVRAYNFLLCGRFSKTNMKHLLEAFTAAAATNQKINVLLICIHSLCLRCY